MMCIQPVRAIRRISTLLAVAVGLSLSGCGVTGSDWKVAEGDQLQDFTLPDSSGKYVSLSDFNAKAIVLSRFATWCPPCQVELKSLQAEVWEKMKDNGVVVIAVSNEDPETVRKYAEREGLTFPVLVDDDGEVAEATGGNSIPRTLLLDSNLTIRRLEIGFYEPKFREMIGQIEELAASQ